MAGAGAEDEAEKELEKAKVVRKAEGVVLPRELSTTYGEIVFGLVPNLSTATQWYEPAPQTYQERAPNAKGKGDRKGKKGKGKSKGGSGKGEGKGAC